MHPILSNRVLPVLAGAALVVVGLNAASYAANGHPILLGHGNSESRTATVANSGKGPALSLKSGKKSPSLAVSSSKVVKHLNADLVDGKSASALGTTATTWTVPSGTTLSYELDGLKPGRYLATLSILMNATAETVCELDETNQPTSVLTYGANRSGVFSMASGAGIFTHVAGKAVVLTCAGATSIYDSSIPSTVTLVKLGHVTTGTVPLMKRGTGTGPTQGSHGPTAH